MGRNYMMRGYILILIITTTYRGVVFISPRGTMRRAKDMKLIKNAWQAKISPVTGLKPCHEPI